MMKEDNDDGASSNSKLNFMPFVAVRNYEFALFFFYISMVSPRLVQVIF